MSEVAQKSKSKDDVACTTRIAVVLILVQYSYSYEYSCSTTLTHHTFLTVPVPCLAKKGTRIRDFMDDETDVRTTYLRRCYYCTYDYRGRVTRPDSDL